MTRRIRILRSGQQSRPVRILKELSLGPKKAVELAGLFGITSAKLGGTLASMERRGLVEKVSRGVYRITSEGSHEVVSLPYSGMTRGTAKGQTVPMEQALVVEPEEQETTTSKRVKKPLHWAVKALFELAEERGFRKDQALEDLIMEKTGQRIPKNTLRYWKNGWSEPKISEVELIAKALGQELELMDLEPKLDPRAQ